MAKDKLKHLMALLMVCLLSIGFTSCGDDDEPNDPTMPESGAWKITSYDDLSVRFDHGSCDREHWDFWQNEFDKEVAKRKLVIRKDTEMEDGWYILSRDDTRDYIGYLSDLEKVKPVSVDGKTMVAEYYLKQYLSVQSDDDYVIFRATVTLAR